MSFTGCIDAIAVHAAAAAITAGGASFTDVAVRFPQARGRSVSVFYGGERESYYFGENVLNAQEIAQAVQVRAMWPLPETGAAQLRTVELEMASFADSFRTRINGDYTLGGNCVALKMLPAPAATDVTSGTKYAVLDWEIGLDGITEYAYAP